MATTWDLLVRGGTLIDPAQSISARRDVAFTGGRVAAVAETLTGEAARYSAADEVWKYREAS
jgi:dihydroorotase